MSGRARLSLAALLCFVGLGLGWEATPGSTGYHTPGILLPGTCISSSDGYLDCTGSTYVVGYWMAGSPDGAARGFAADARVVLVPAVGALLWAARRRTPASVRAVQVVAVALGVISVRAAGEGQVAGAALGAVAVVLLVSALRRAPLARSAPGAVAPPPTTGAVGQAF